MSCAHGKPETQITAGSASFASNEVATVSGIKVDACSTVTTGASMITATGVDDGACEERRAIINPATTISTPTMHANANRCCPSQSDKLKVGIATVVF